jgi:thiamine biosynthesis lipoprotein
MAGVATLRGDTMGTSWSVRLSAVRAVVPPGLEDAVRAVLDTVIAQMSNWEPDSDISRFNRAPVGTWCDLPPAFRHVLSAALDIAARSGGAFDPTVGNAVESWGFGPSRTRSRAWISPSPDWRAIDLDAARARRRADLALDFAGIAKGYAVDAVAHCLRERGHRHFLVEIGGELRGEGVKPDGQPWWVDLEVPPGLSLPATHVALCQLSVATSGDYRRWFEEEGRRYAHSIDPRTAAPVANAVASVSVLHDSAMIADAWATALTVLGPRDGMALAQREKLAVLMITREPAGPREWMSPALAAMLG